MDGSYGDYFVETHLSGDEISTSCNCPYPGRGCKHTVAVLLDIIDCLSGFKAMPVASIKDEDDESGDVSVEEIDDYLSSEEIRKQALDDRQKRAGKEELRLIFGDMLKGDHLVETMKGRKYACHHA